MPEAILYYAYTLNRVRHQSQSTTPFENCSGNKPSIRHLPFGTTAYVGVPKQTRSSKFDPKAKKGFFVGYAMSTRVWLPDSNKIIETINVRFGNEAVFPKDMHKHQEQGLRYSKGTNPFSIQSSAMVVTWAYIYITL